MVNTAEPSTSSAPFDIHNQVLIGNVSPVDWTNPKPANRYHLVVVGAGTAGLIAASFAAGAGAKVALVERHSMGGDCLNTGCVPSKSLLRSSRVCAELRDAAALGWHLPKSSEADFGAVMSRMRQVRARISLNDSVARYREKGVDVFMGHGRFTSSSSIQVGGSVLRFRRAVVATGARPALLSVPGLVQADCLTNETVFDLTERPTRLAVVGGGPVGVELAQAFQRLGSEVTLLEKDDQVLFREDPEAAMLVQESLINDGVRVEVGCRVEKVECQGNDKVIYCSNGSRSLLKVDEILIATGRIANTDGLNLEAAGVDYTQQGVTVDGGLRTSNPRVYAAGDICLAWKFTHMAEEAAMIAARNALFPGRKSLTVLTIPSCTYTDPEVAHVGISSRQAAEQGDDVLTYTHYLRDVDRAVIDGEDTGFVRVHIRKGSDEILGATIVAAHAGEIISEVTLAMVANLGLRTLANVIHPYPTCAEALRRVALRHSVGRITPVTRRLFKLWFKLTS